MNDFARKAVHWTQDDVKAAAAVLCEDLWDLDYSIRRLRTEHRLNGSSIREGYEIETDIRPIAKLILSLDRDYSAAESLLIFVHEFRCLIEGAESTEGTNDVSPEQTTEGNHSDR